MPPKDRLSAEDEVKRIIADEGRPTRRLPSKARQAAIERLERDGYRVIAEPPIERAVAKLGVRVKPGGTVKIGAVSDTHIGSNYQQITSLTDFYAYADARGVTQFLHAGDMLEGLHVHRGAAYEQYALGAAKQAKAAVAQYPRSKNGPTNWIEGNHDAWTYENSGVEVNELITPKRPDLVYLGYYSAFVEVGPLRILLQHGAKGGGPYGKSYKPQRLLEQLEPIERERTQIA
jgi:hypothetical protein